MGVSEISAEFVGLKIVADRPTMVVLKVTLGVELIDSESRFTESIYGVSLVSSSFSTESISSKMFPAPS